MTNATQARAGPGSPRSPRNRRETDTAESAEGGHQRSVRRQRKALALIDDPALHAGACPWRRGVTLAGQPAVRFGEVAGRERAG